MSRDQISIALATFNGAAHLPEQLASIAAQRHRPHELVVCDDGSQDGTIELVEEFAQRAPFPVRIFENQVRIGFVDNFLKAAGLCTGGAIAWCDQDDVWHPDKLRAAAAVLASESDCGIVVHSSVVADGALTPTRQRLPRVWRTGIRNRLRCDPWLTPPGFAQVFSRELLELVPAERRPMSFSRDEPMLHDEWSYFLGFSTRRVGLVARPLATYRRHNSNTSGAPTPRHRQRGGAEIERYTRSARRCREYAELLDSLAGHLPAETAALAGAAGFYRSWQRQWERRAEVYESEGIRRVARVGSSLGGYRPRSRGGLGFFSLAKDTASSVR